MSCTRCIALGFLAGTFLGTVGWAGEGSGGTTAQIMPPSPAISAPSACRVEGNLSACGLPSQAVIDRTHNRVQRTVAEWRARLTPEQYAVLREQATEPPFRNAYWDDHADGVYVCLGCDTPLFDSRQKFASGTGWPSFGQPLEPTFVGEARDLSHGLVRIETHCAICGGHLGHVFDDGPQPTGRRYCINSASLRFIPREAYAAWVQQQGARPVPHP